MLQKQGKTKVGLEAYAKTNGEKYGRINANI